MKYSPAQGENALLSTIANEIDSLNIFNIPSDCDRIEFSPDQETCTLLTFKKGGNALMALYFQRNAEGKVTAIGID
jgi:hypothetical protein